MRRRNYVPPAGDFTAFMSSIGAEDAPTFSLAQCHRLSHDIAQQERVEYWQQLAVRHLESRQRAWFVAACGWCVAVLMSLIVMLLMAVVR